MKQCLQEQRNETYLRKVERYMHDRLSPVQGRPHQPSLSGTWVAAIPATGTIKSGQVDIGIVRSMKIDSTKKVWKKLQSGWTNMD